MSGAEILFDHVHVICEEPEAAAAWYADMLGGTVTRRSEVRGAPQIAVQFNGATILVRGRRPGEQPAKRPPLQSFENFVSHDQWGHRSLRVQGRRGPGRILRRHPAQRRQFCGGAVRIRAGHAHRLPCRTRRREHRAR